MYFVVLHVCYLMVAGSLLGRYLEIVYLLWKASMAGLKKVYG